MSRTTAKAIVAELARIADPKIREQGERQFAITGKKIFGIRMTAMQQIAKRAGTDHALALALWKSGWYEARTVAAMVDDPEAVTPAQMDAWCKDFDNWAICDSCCFKLFDQTPHLFPKINAWAKRKPEFEKRAAFALLASAALHRRDLPDAPFVKALALCEQAGSDDRNFVKKAVVWALRSVANRSKGAHAAALESCERLIAQDTPSSRWIGKTAKREIVKRAK